MQHVQSEEHQNSSCKYLIYCISYCHHHIQQTQYWMVSGFQYTLWIYLTSEFHEDRLSLSQRCVWSLFVSWSQLQHRLLDKFDKIPSLKKEIIISTLRHIPLIFPNLLNSAMGTFNLRTVFTCWVKDVQRFGKQQFFPRPEHQMVVHSYCVYSVSA